MPTLFPNQASLPVLEEACLCGRWEYSVHCSQGEVSASLSPKKWYINVYTTSSVVASLESSRPHDRAESKSIHTNLSTFPRCKSTAQLPARFSFWAAFLHLLSVYKVLAPPVSFDSSIRNETGLNLKMIVFDLFVKETERHISVSASCSQGSVLSEKLLSRWLVRLAGIRTGRDEEHFWLTETDDESLRVRLTLIV